MIMTRILPLIGLFKNLRQEISPLHKRLYLTQERAYESLKRLTGRDYGYRVEEWENYLLSINYDVSKIEAEKKI
jgi:hypothetical protein